MTVGELLTQLVESLPPTHRVLSRHRTQLEANEPQIAKARQVLLTQIDACARLQRQRSPHLLLERLSASL